MILGSTIRYRIDKKRALRERKASKRSIVGAKTKSIESLHQRSTQYREKE